MEWSALRLRRSAGSWWWGPAARPFQVAAKAEKGKARRGEAPTAGAEPRHRQRQLCRWAGNPPVHVPLSARRARIRALRLRLRPAAARPRIHRSRLGRAWRDCGRWKRISQRSLSPKKCDRARCVARVGDDRV